VRTIAKTNGCSVAEVSRVLDLFPNATITDQIRKHTLALELSRLDELQEAFYEQAMGGDVQSGALFAKIIERRCTMLGLYTPPAAVLQVAEAQAAKQTSTEKIRGLLDNIQHITPRERELIEKQRKEGFDPQVRAEINQLRAQRGKPPLSDSDGPEG
jgi:hypothetical protein